MAKPDDKLKAVEKTGQRLTDAEERVEAARSLFYEAVRDARAAGVSISAIARARGVSRQSIQKLVDRIERG